MDNPPVLLATEARVTPPSDAWSGKPYRTTVSQVLHDFAPATVLDSAAGLGWLAQALPSGCAIDGLDYYQVAPPPGYRHFHQADLNQGLPAHLGRYDAIVCCEAIAYLVNPGLYLQTLRQHLNPGGKVIISSPNPAYLGARLHLLWKGFFTSFPPTDQNERPAAHMPWLPLCWHQFWLLLGLNGFSDIQVHDVDEPKPKHLWERLLAPFARGYARRRQAKAKTPETQSLWRQAASDQVLMGRRLVISATYIGDTPASPSTAGSA